MLNSTRYASNAIARSISAPTTHASQRIIGSTSRSNALPLIRILSKPSVRSFHLSPRCLQQQAAAGQTAPYSESSSRYSHAQHTGSDVSPNSTEPATKFHELLDRGLVCQTIVDTLTRDMRLETMTLVQIQTINETLKGIDVLAQARTGTGKTVAFLLPILQNIITRDPSLERRSYERRPKGGAGSAQDIRAIIVSPTRELAEQIAVEARKVTKNTGIVVQTAVGGSAKATGLRQIKFEGCHVLVATPGRLKDILSDEYSGVKAPNCSAFVLDEADRLLDQGFYPDIVEIQKLLPDPRKVDRQTLLFSATVPNEVMKVVQQTMKPNFKFVQTVKEGEQQTHDTVPQKLATLNGFENAMPALLELSKRELEKNQEPFKAIVYFGASSEVILAHNVFENLRESGESRFGRHPLDPMKLISISARLSQQQRTRAADDFRRARTAILFSSDVTARGMDFPNVSHVIQIGIPSSRDTYIHRIGRTARAGKSGAGWLFMTPWEIAEAHGRLHKLPIKLDESLETAKVDMTKQAQLPEYVAKILTATTDAAKMAPGELKAAAYKACLGVYTWFSNKRTLVTAMNNRARFGWGSEKMPAINASLAKKLGIYGIPGLVTESGGGGSFRDDRQPGDRSFSAPRSLPPRFGDRGVGRGGPGRESGGYGGRPSFSDRGSGGRGDSGGYGRGRDRDDSSRGSYGGRQRQAEY